MAFLSSLMCKLLCKLLIIICCSFIHSGFFLHIFSFVNPEWQHQRIHPPQPIEDFVPPEFFPAKHVGNEKQKWKVLPINRWWVKIFKSLSFWKQLPGIWLPSPMKKYIIWLFQDHEYGYLQMHTKTKRKSAKQLC